MDYWIHFGRWKHTGTKCGLTQAAPVEKKKFASPNFLNSPCYSTDIPCSLWGSFNVISGPSLHQASLELPWIRQARLASDAGNRGGVHGKTLSTKRRKLYRRNDCENHSMKQTVDEKSQRRQNDLKHRSPNWLSPVCSPARLDYYRINFFLLLSISMTS